MSFSLSSLKALNLDSVKADLVKVEDVVAVVAKYEGDLPLPAYVGTALSELQKVLSFAVSVLSEV